MNEVQFTVLSEQTQLFLFCLMLDYIFKNYLLFLLFLAFYSLSMLNKGS